MDRILDELNALNGQIRDEGVKCRINRIGQLTAGIFQAVIDKPERESDVRKFMNYYLPTTLKLLKSYEMLEEQSVQGENITASREKIENVIKSFAGFYVAVFVFSLNINSVSAIATTTGCIGINNSCAFVNNTC